jgi:hypothetical protein
MRRVAFTFIAILVSGAATFTQNGARLPAQQGVDLSGSWQSGQWTEGGGPGGANDRRPFDFLGIPLSEAGKAWTLSHDEARLSQPERQCGFYTPTYHPFGFGPLNIWREDEYQMGTALAWVFGGFQDFKPQVIWMDGRPHPGPLEPHRIEGFTTGVWENDVLVTTTTHMTQGMLHRRAPHSDRATMTMRLSRHDDILSMTGRIDDPIYLTEPLYVSKEWRLTSNMGNRAVPPCTVTFEGVEPGEVKRYLPGQNPNINEMTELWGIPMEAVMGGAETMYPEYRKKLRETYTRPERRPFGATRNGTI